MHPISGEILNFNLSVIRLNSRTPRQLSGPPPTVRLFLQPGAPKAR